MQSAIAGWSNAQCFTNMTQVQNITAPVFVTSPPLVPNLNGTLISKRNIFPPQLSDLQGRKLNLVSPKEILKRNLNSKTDTESSLDRRATCTSIQVAPGDGCWSLATKCGITSAQLVLFNTPFACSTGICPNFCNTLQPYQHICCSAGTLVRTLPY